MELFDAYFRRSDLDGDGRISGVEAVAFFQGSNLPKHAQAQVHLFSRSFLIYLMEFGGFILHTISHIDEIWRPNQV